MTPREWIMLATFLLAYTVQVVVFVSWLNRKLSAMETRIAVIESKNWGERIERMEARLDKKLDAVLLEIKTIQGEIHREFLGCPNHRTRREN